MFLLAPWLRNHETNISNTKFFEMEGRKQIMKHSQVWSIFSWSRTSYVHGRGLFWHFPNWQFWDTHLCLSPAECTLYSNTHLKSLDLHTQHTDPGMIHSCIYHIPAQECKALLKNHKSHTYPHASRTAVRWLFPVASCTLSDLDYALPSSDSISVTLVIYLSSYSLINNPWLCCQ